MISAVSAASTVLAVVGALIAWRVAIRRREALAAQLSAQQPAPPAATLGLSADPGNLSLPVLPNAKWPAAGAEAPQTVAVWAYAVPAGHSAAVTCDVVQIRDSEEPPATAEQQSSAQSRLW